MKLLIYSLAGESVDDPAHHALASEIFGTVNSLDEADELLHKFVSEGAEIITYKELSREEFAAMTTTNLVVIP